MHEIDKDQLLRHIAKSDLTALEKRYLENLVRADGSAKVGHWIDRTDWTVLEYGKFGHPAYECSECGYKKRTPNEGSFDPHKGGKFCDECGARMGGDDDHVGQDADDREVPA